LDFGLPPALRFPAIRPAFRPKLQLTPGVRAALAQPAKSSHREPRNNSTYGAHVGAHVALNMSAGGQTVNFVTLYRKKACEIRSHSAHKKSCQHERSCADLKLETWNLKTCLNTQVALKNRSSAAPNRSSALPNPSSRAQLEPFAGKPNLTTLSRQTTYNFAPAKSASNFSAKAAGGHSPPYLSASRISSMSVFRVAIYAFHCCSSEPRSMPIDSSKIWLMISELRNVSGGSSPRRR
jgi:hypothetical protein